jgi:hypothetical protein
MTYTYTTYKAMRAEMAEATLDLLINERDTLRAALMWALDQIDDDPDPDHQAALAAAHKALESAS